MSNRINDLCTSRSARARGGFWCQWPSWFQFHGSIPMDYIEWISNAGATGAQQPCAADPQRRIFFWTAAAYSVSIDILASQRLAKIESHYVKYEFKMSRMPESHKKLPKPMLLNYLLSFFLSWNQKENLFQGVVWAYRKLK